MSKSVKAIICLIFFSAFAYFCWYAYFVEIDNLSENDIPLLKAQTGIKSKPENPGGMEVQNKDKAIYTHMLGEKKIDNKIRVIGDYEKPVSRESLEDLINKQLHTKDVSSTAEIKIKKLEQSKKKEPLDIKKISSKYTIRVAKLKDKKFLFKGIEIFQNRYPVLNKYNGELIESNGDYFLHFSSMKSKQEADTICKELMGNGDKCSLHPMGQKNSYTATTKE